MPMGNYFISKKPGRQVVSFLFSTKEGGKRNVYNEKRGNKRTVQPYRYRMINVARDEMTEINEVGDFLYIS